MADLSTSYLGLKLRNPLILSSSGLTDNADKIKKAADAGIGAVVMKSLFEESIIHEAEHTMNDAYSAEADDYVMEYTKEHTISEFLNQTEKAKKSCSIPVFASINAVQGIEWLAYAKRFESAGADGLELNMHIIPTTKAVSGAEIEDRYFNTIEAVKNELKIPIAVKLSYHFSNLLNVVHRLEASKVDGIVMFNRFYEPDIDIDDLSFKAFPVFSKADDLRHALRWTGILSSFKNNIDISVSTGVHSYADVAKSILAGASTVQICSAVYQHGLDVVGGMLDGLDAWMTEKSFETIDDFKGYMSYKTVKDSSIYERAQFMKYFSNHG